MRAILLLLRLLEILVVAVIILDAALSKWVALTGDVIVLVFFVALEMVLRLIRRRRLHRG